MFFNKRLIKHRYDIDDYLPDRWAAPAAFLWLFIATAAFGQANNSSNWHAGGVVQMCLNTSAARRECAFNLLMR
jgi:hypothetical protein